MQIQKLRLKRAWSQQQLAEACGLSTRTIQRIEAGQSPSTETLKCIAAVFEVDFSTLQTENEMTTATLSLDQKQEQDAFAQVRQLRRFYLHCLRYVLVNGVLLGINLATQPNRWWALWVAGGWGIALALQAIRTFSSIRLLGPDWEKRQVEKRLGRPL